MSALKILITGGSGLLGQYLNLSLSEENEILTLYNLHEGNCKDFNPAKVDITDFNSFNKIFDEFNPDVVIHTAAYTNPVILPGIKTKDIFKLNVNASKNIAEQCGRTGCKLIYISTDLVYAGYRGSMLKEDAKLIPASLYAETKLVAENKVKEALDNYIILRTALLYGLGLTHTTCHFHQMYVNLINLNKVKLFTDQYRTPLSLKDAARMMKDIVKLDIKSETINFGGKERLSRYELGEMLCEIAGLDKNLLIGVSLSEMTGIPQVADVSMNTDKLQSLSIIPKSIEESIRELEGL